MKSNKLLKLTLGSCLMWVTALTAQAQSCYPAEFVKQFQEKRKARQEQVAKPANKAPQTYAATVPTLYGSIYDADADYAKGIYSFQPNSNITFTNVAKHEHLNVAAGTYANGKYYSINYVEPGWGATPDVINLSIFDAETWKEEKNIVNPSFSCIATELAYDPTTGSIYGCFFSPDSYGVAAAKVLATLNTETGKPEVIATMTEHMIGLACSKDGILYGLSDHYNLYSIDKQTGELTAISNGKINNAYQDNPFLQSAEIDFETGKMYHAGFVNDFGDTGIIEIDVTTGKGKTLVNLYDSGSLEQITGMFMKQSGGAIVVSPQAATNLSFNAEGAALNGTFTFTLPTKDSQGKDLSGVLNFSVQVNGVQKAGGSADAGEQVTCNLDVNEPGSYKISVVVSTSDATSGGSTASLTTWIGQDVPCPVDNMGLSNEGKKLNLFWGPSTKSVHGGYLGNVGYKVVRYPGAIVVSENQKEREFSEVIEDEVIRSYSYEVIAVAGGMESEAVRSNEVILGSVIGELPYLNQFSYQEDFNQFSVIDANNDGSTWKYDAGQKSAVYEYNSKNAADDWLITPGVMLEASQLYKISFKVSNTFPEEKISVAYGRAATVEGMATEILAPYAVTYQPRVHELYAEVVPAENGVYYFGIKACSEADRSTMIVDDVEFTAVSGQAPAKVENMVVTPAEKGALSATVSFNIPTKCIDGTPLEDLQEFVIRRNKQIIERVAYTGADKISYEDKSIVDNGQYTYVVTAVNGEGEGAEATAKQYVGVDVPGPIENFKVVEDLNEEGTLVLTWDAPSAGQHGGYVDPAKLTYFISAGMSLQPICNDNKTTYRDKLNISRGQTYQGYSVYAENEVGSGRNVWQTKVAVAGPAIKAPYYDSFSDVHLNGPWLTNVLNGEIGEASWIALDGTLLESGSNDNDSGLMSFSTTALNRSARLESPKIDIRGIENAKFIFWVYLNGTTKDTMEAQVSAEYAPFETVQSVTLNEGKGWKRYEISLDAYKDKRFIQVGFVGTSVETLKELIAVDNISIKSPVNKDLEIMTCDIPAVQLRVGEVCQIALQLRNSGSVDVKAKDFTIDLYKNDKLVNSFKGEDIEVDQRLKCMIEDKITVADPEDTYYYVEVNYKGDEKMDNNKSAKTMIHVLLSNYPRVTDLTGKPASDHVKLSWSDPDMNSMQAEAITDHFEDYQSFAIDNFGKWKVYDGDGQKTIQLTLNMEDGPLTYDHAGEPMAFQVFNVDEAGIPLSSWNPYSGSQMLCAFKCTAKGAAPKNDDWLISPELCGKAQKISFFAKAGMAAEYEDGSMTIPEEFEVYYSTTTDDVTSFQKIGETVQINEVKKWEEVRVELPEGAKYFAVRCVSDNKFVLMLDDFTYIPAGGVIEDISLVGYNVYKDGKKITPEMIGEAYYNDRNVESGKEYTYNVTAVYDKGESMFSNDFTIVFTPSSIDENVMCTVLIYAKDNNIMISGADHVNVAVYTLSGNCLFNELVDGDVTVPAAEGVYLVKVGNQVNKVLVR